MRDEKDAKIWSLRELPELEENLFQQWQLLLEDRIGLSLPSHRKVFLQTNLGARMREIGCHSYDDYFKDIKSGQSGLLEWLTLIDRLTVQETRFFRDHEALEEVRAHLLSQGEAFFTSHSISAWSVGCSTGEEPYSLAIVLYELGRSLNVKNFFGVTGTDISKPALAKARQGCYPRRKFVSVSNEMLNQYFESTDQQTYCVSDAIKKRVSFSRLNILDLEAAPMTAMDVIYCQNVLIYFKKSRRNQILSQLAEKLAPGGLLVLGQGEVTGFSHPLLRKKKTDRALAFERKH